MTSYPQSTATYGWAGRTADLLGDQGYNPRLAMNISLAGSNVWQNGQGTLPYVLGLGGAQEFDAVVNGGSRRAVFEELQRQAAAGSNVLASEYAGTQKRAGDLAAFVNTGLDGATLTTAFPRSLVGAQLRTVARMVQARGALGVSRQMFFIGLGGWDTHDTQLTTQAALMSRLSPALLAFQNAMSEIGAENLVTLFTASDFGRTLTSNGDGSDHGWGGHALVMGGAVRGRQIHGTMPSLAINGPDDAKEGRIIPTTGIDQYAATLARWFGVSDSDLNLVFPNLPNFATQNLGFLA